MRSNLYLIVINLTLLIILLIGNVKTNNIISLTQFNPQLVTALTIHREDKNSLELVKQNQQWKLQQKNDVFIDADNELVNSLLKLLNTPVHHSLQLTNQQWQKLSLQEPEDIPATAKDSQSYIDINIKTTNKSVNTRIIFGQEESLSLLRYIRIEQQVFLINSYYYYLLFRDFQKNISTLNRK